AARWLRWGRLSLPQLMAIAAGIGGAGLASLLTALCLDSRHLGGGLPDLLLL
ncbi:hypothetical protein JKP88DRAFT_232155, partial [Tribonema minus]